MPTPGAAGAEAEETHPVSEEHTPCEPGKLQGQPPGQKPQSRPSTSPPSPHPLSGLVPVTNRLACLGRIV